MITKRILVTGATGFVGHALCKRMLNDGWNVRGTARSAGRAAVIPAGVDFIQIRSIGETTDWSEALGNIDMVVHTLMESTSGRRSRRFLKSPLRRGLK